MKILLIGIDGGTSEHLFSDERLENIRRLLEYGCYGKLSLGDTSDRLEMWTSLVTSQNLGKLGKVRSEEIESVQGTPIWKWIEEQDKDVIVIGTPPFISYPLEMKTRVENLLLDMSLKGENLTIQDPDSLINQVYALSRKQMDLVRILMQSKEWHYFQFVDDGLYQLQRSGFDKSENSSQDLFADYCFYLDEQIGTILELLDDDTIVLVVSLRATNPFDGSLILASSNNPLAGEVEGAHLLDLAPTLLELSGYKVPAAMQGNSLVAGKMLKDGNNDELTADEEEILREQLSGLGYIE